MKSPDYIRLLQEPSIPRKTRLGLIDKAFGAQADEYLGEFFKAFMRRRTFIRVFRM